MKSNIILFVLIAFINSSLSIAQNQSKEITLSDIWKKHTFSAKSVHGIRSMKDGEHYCTLNKDDEILEYSYKDAKKTRTIATLQEMLKGLDKKDVEIDDYAFSSDESQILIATETDDIYRHSSKSNFYIWDINKKKLSPLSDGGKQRLADFSPDGSKVAFVRDNNIFVKDLADNKELQITHDGKERFVINGTTDWVYEEEFSFTKGFHWSPDGNKIAYYRFDENNVKEFWLTKYGELYPEEYKYKYPKSGEANSVVSIHVFDLTKGDAVKIETGEEKDQYIARMKWTNDPNLLSLQRLNRLQNKLELLIADANTGKPNVVYTDKSKYYIDITNDLTFLKDNEHFLITSERSGYNHIYVGDMKDNSLRQLTTGDWDVRELKGIDENASLIYYISAEGSPFNSELYSIKLDAKGKKKISSREGSNSVRFSSTYKYYINNFSDANTPPYYSICNSKGKELKILENNEKLIGLMKKYDFSRKKFFEFTTSEGIELNAWRIDPPDFDPTKKYPLFMYVYGGPNSQTVTNSWGRNNLLWFQLLAQKGYIVVSVDNRGTGARGEEFRKNTYLELGKFETIDQIEAAQYLGSLDYVDKNRIGIFGWSYGGYISSLCITKGADYFKLAIAVAPVTNWRYYDNIYTERFMRTPQENGENYDDNSPINFVDKLKGKYLLVHGTADDNVHVQNSMDMITALVKANKQFDLMLYPNKNHGIYGGNTRYHLFKKMTDFVLENL
ncbi:MAG: S9 family peptidase [Bacteroidales bacterium]|nr:S9 family peptidase [Bacteroidales bacterium]